MTIAIIVFEFVVLLFSAVLHEVAHGYEAERLGDDTARRAGRLTLNPLAHIDLFGTVIIPLTMILLAPGFAILGWGKPVMIDARNFKRPIMGDILTSLAGPLSNIVLALLVSVGFGLGLMFDGLPTASFSFPVQLRQAAHQLERDFRQGVEECVVLRQRVQR